MFGRIEMEGVERNGRGAFIKYVFGCYFLGGNGVANKGREDPSQPSCTVNLLTPQIGGLRRVSAQCFTILLFNPYNVSDT